MKAKVSVIIPTYNCVDNISKSIQSVLEQTYDNIEVIVVDDCSTDGTVEVIRKEYPEVKLVVLEKNSGGPSKPRNVGIKESSGEYLAFLDSDDLWNKYKIESQLMLMLDKNINFCCTAAKIIDKNDNEVSALKPRVRANKPFKIDKLIRNSFVVTSSVLVKKSEESWFKFDENDMFKNGAEDLSLWLNVIKNYHYGICMSDDLVYYRDYVGSGSITSNSSLKQSFIVRDICVNKFYFENESNHGFLMYKIYFTFLLIMYKLRAKL